MAVNLQYPEKPLEIDGACWSSTAAAIKAPGQPDLVLLRLAETATVAGVFTRNAFAAAPVMVAREHLQAGSVRALLINSGNANAGTGEAGVADARQCCRQVAQALGLAPQQVLPFSTGVIGQRLPMKRLSPAIQTLTGQEPPQDALAAARAIMTTDTVPKVVSRRVQTATGQTIHLTGIAKGSGMICPNMATMLAFVTTDAAIPVSALQQALQDCVVESFNSITVDGDTSTNDAAMLCATGTGPALDSDQAGWSEFMQALRTVMIELACAIVRDAEGATRFITVDVQGAQTVAEARAVAFTVAQSPLFKTAAFAGDPNWGRILAAVGRAPVPDLDVGAVAIALDEVTIVRDGQPVADYREERAARVMAQSEFCVHIGLGRGQAGARIWTSDLSYEYVRINAEYRS